MDHADMVHRVHPTGLGISNGFDFNPQYGLIKGEGHGNSRRQASARRVHSMHHSR